MKGILTTILMIFCSTAFAQWLPNGATTGNIYYNGGSVGIGNSSPETNLQIDGGAGGSSVMIGNTTSSHRTSLWLKTEGTTGKASIQSWWAGVNQGVLSINASGGNVGIGTTSPSSKLTVYDAGNANGSGITIGNTNTGFTSIAMGTSAETNGFSYIGSIKASGSAWGDLILNQNGGNVGIGTIAPDAKLAVAGQVHAQEVKVSVAVPGPDYVFEKSYSLPTLEQVKSYIEANKHLPEVPSAKEMEQDGIKLSEMNMLLLKKVEELTLYVIELKRENDQTKSEIESIKNQLKTIK